MGLISILKDFYKEPVPAEPIKDPGVVDKTYAQWRMRIFLSMFFGYLAIYFSVIWQCFFSVIWRFYNLKLMRIKNKMKHSLGNNTF